MGAIFTCKSIRGPDLQIPKVACPQSWLTIAHGKDQGPDSSTVGTTHRGRNDALLANTVTNLALTLGSPANVTPTFKNCHRFLLELLMNNFPNVRVCCSHLIYC